jgi:hypothetical protein
VFLENGIQIRCTINIDRTESNAALVGKLFA